MTAAMNPATTTPAIPAVPRTTTMFRRGEYHRFAGDGAPYVYLVPSAAVFRLDDVSVAVLDALGSRDYEPADLALSLAPRFALPDVKEAVEELVRVRAIKAFEKRLPVPGADVAVAPAPAVAAPARKRVPLTTLVVNVTTEPYHYADPDEFRLDPHGTLPYDWTRKDG